MFISCTYYPRFRAVLVTILAMRCDRTIRTKTQIKRIKILRFVITRLNYTIRLNNIIGCARRQTRYDSYFTQKAFHRTTCERLFIMFYSGYGSFFRLKTAKISFSACACILSCSAVAALSSLVAELVCTTAEI